jgi:hypothetical protein
LFTNLGKVRTTLQQLVTIPNGNMFTIVITIPNVITVPNVTSLTPVDVRKSALDQGNTTLLGTGVVTLVSTDFRLGTSCFIDVSNPHLSP